ncbi:1-acyl-sn-glycerol-3-phosphate acyltransferase [Tundrisphaera lichenicola]|uniref:1-acyl-sn-glycerol-3-phosphate acyltransferase n=1 Tax=Tundrisphaera lichenicola TaxID=2029860 RepID=UPI003EBD815C
MTDLGFPATIESPTFGTIGLVAGLIVLGVVAWVALLPWIVQPFLRLVLWFRYDLKRVGLENLPRTGPVLLASNHMSWFDGFFLAASLPRRGTALMNSDVFRWPVIGYLARRCGLISVPYRGPKAQRAAIEVCRQALAEGRLLGIFPEGQLSRNGLTGPFHRGLEVILAKREDVAVIPVYLDNVWGSIMSFSGGKFVKKRPEGWRRTVVISFGPRVEPPVTAFKVRQAVLAAGVVAHAQLGRHRPIETIDPTLPHFEHPRLGLLTASTPDFTMDDTTQIGHKAGSVGSPLPGVVIRAVDESGEPLPADGEGRLQALVAGQADWVDLDRQGRVDRDGFIFLT